MTRKEYKALLKTELKTINIKIDKLILNGKPYTKEAKAHRNIIAKLNAFK